METGNLYHKETLHSGLRVITIPMPSSRSVTVMAMVGAGSRYEKKKTNGLSHFMEHMFFKGAKRYPDTMAVSSAIDSVGGVFNAFTGEDKVGYFVKLSSAKKRVSYDVLSDMLLNSKFEKEEIDRERGVIIEEIRMYNDDPMSKVQIDFKNHFFGDQPLGWDIAGPEENIKAVTQDQFFEYRNIHYTSASCVLVAAGGITHEENIELSQEFFKFTNRGIKSQAPEYRPMEGERSRLTTRDIEQAHLVMGFPIPGDEDQDQPALKMLNNILGGTMSSRLFYQVRERRGLAYYIRSSRGAFVDTGALRISAGINVEKLEEAIACIKEELDKMANDGVTDDELDRARENIKGRNDLSLENSMSVAMLYADHETLHGKVKTPDEMHAEIDRVTLPRVNEVAKKYIDMAKIKMAVLGPYDDLAPFDKKLDG
ncbi:FIG007959: peptidase, M16 family [hydrothermal vent metagenome]|uniref:FIG007959: peptidase, M16 family n=1 Tax=hydrothermal vent metagenome TaxID=652676 RepID=A0A3B1BY80_9ZZZZ